MIIDLLQQQDLEQVGYLTPEGWDDLEVHFAYNLQAAFCVPVKAVVDEQLAGLGNIIYNADTAWLAQIVVHPGFRNRGIGKAITGALLDLIDRQRYATVLLDATDLGFPVYHSYGFEVVSHHMHFKGTQSGTLGADPGIGPFEEQELAAVLQLDRKACGEDRANTLLEHIANAFVYKEGGKIAGAYFPTLGKGAVIAAHAEAGRALMKLRMQEKQHAMLPEENLQATQFLLQQDFTVQRRSRRMRLGKALEWQPEMIYNVTGGALG